MTSDSDIIIIDVSSSNINTFQIINIYNEKSLDLDIDQSIYTVKRSLQHIQLSKKTLIADDFNSHHNWWNSSIANFIRADSLITWLNSYNCELINESDIAIFYRKNDNSTSSSIIDLAFATQKLSEDISDWYINESNASDSDHEIIRFNIKTKAAKLIENSICSQFFNLKKADWKLFSKEILLQTKYIDFSYLNHSNDLNDLNTTAIELQNIIYAAANKSIVKKKSFEKSKFWWSEELINLRKSYFFIRRK